MTEIPNALIKDLLSTGYFFEELKHYAKSKEMDITSYSRNFAVPYLARISESYEGSGQTQRSRILNLAVEHLSNVNDDEMVASIFGLKKAAASEVDVNAKALSHIDQLDKSEALSCRQRVESAESLVKLLVSIIRIFKLAEVRAKRNKAEESEVRTVSSEQ